MPFSGKERLRVTVSALAVLVAACGDGSGGNIEQARAQLDKGDRNAAIVTLRSVIQTDPNSGQSRLLLAQALLQGEEWTGADVEFGKAKNLGQSDNEVVPGLAQARVQMGKQKAVLDEFGSTKLTDAKAQDELDGWLAMALARQGQRKEARAKAQSVLQRNPGQAVAAVVLARAMGSDGEVDAGLLALDAAQKAGAKGPELVKARADLLLYGKRDLAAAKQAYQEVVALAPGRALAHSTLVEVNVALNDRAGAKAALDAMQKALPKHPQTRLAMTQYAILTEDFGRARELIQPLLQVAPDDVQLLTTSASIELQLKAVTQAISLLQRAVYVSPQAVAPRIALARAYLKAGRPKLVFDVLRPVTEAIPDEPSSPMLLAEASLQTGDPQRAEAYYRRALALKPSDANVRTAVALTQMGRNPTSAIAELQAVSEGTKDTVADMALISSLLKQRNFTGAGTAIEKLAVKTPNSAMPSMMLSQIALLQLDLVAARRHLEAAVAKDPVYAPAVLSLAAMDRSEGKAQEAQARLDSLLKHDPKNMAVLLAMADQKIKANGTPADILKSLDAAIAGNSGEAAPRAAKINYQTRIKDFKGALTTAAAANAALPEDLALLSMLGNAQMLAGELNQAVSTFSKLISKTPNSAEAHVQLAQAQIQAKNFDAAEKSLKRALETAPTSVEARRAYIALGLRTKRPQVALDAARAIQRDRPAEAIGYLIEGDIHVQLRDNDSAAKAYRVALTKKGATGAAEKLFAALATSSQPTTANEFANDWLKRNPQDTELRFALANRAIEESDFATADRLLSEILKVQPKMASALNNLAWVKVQLGQAGGVALAQQATALAPNRPELLDTLALALAADKQFAKAVETSRLTVSLAPEVPQYRIALAMHLLSSGDRAASQAQVDQLPRDGLTAQDNKNLQALKARLSH